MTDEEKECFGNFKGVKNTDIAEVLIEHAGKERFEQVYFPLTGRVAFLDFDERGVDTSDKSKEAVYERTALWADMDANASHWVAAFTNLVDNILDEIEADNDAPAFHKGDKVLVKDNYHRVWAEAVFVTEWNGFYYTSNDADDGRSLNRWEECRPYKAVQEDKCSGDSCPINVN